MQLNTIQPAEGAKHAKRRVGRGIGSGLGKTAGRGHKGQKSRAGGFHKVGFEGGQMPLQRRIPKRGFKSQQKPFKAEVRLGDLAKLAVDQIDLLVLKQAGLVSDLARSVRVIKAGELDRALDLAGLDDLDRLGDRGHQARGLEREHVDFGGAEGFELGQGDLGVELQQVRLEAALGKTTLQRHLAAFETDLVVAARTRLLALVATASGLAQAGTDAAADTALGMLGARCGLDVIQLHRVPLVPIKEL